jgi:hypothetical protein
VHLACNYFNKEWSGREKLKMYSDRNSRLGGISERTIIENNSLHWKLLAAKLRGASTSDPLKNAYSLTRIKEAIGKISRKSSIPHPLHPSIFDPI